MGEVLPTVPAELTLAVEITGGEGQTLEWIRNGETFASGPVTVGVQRQQITPRPGDWFSVVCRNSAGEATLISNAIYVRRSQ